MPKKTKKIGSRILIALPIIGIGLGWKIHFLYKIDFFTLSFNIGILSLVVGLLIIIGPKFKELNEAKPSSFLLHPKRWIVNLLKSLTLILILVVITLLVNSMSTQLSLDWLKYRVDINSEIALSKVIGFREKLEFGKFTKSYQKFAKIQFRDGKSIREEFIILERDSNVKIGDEIEVRFRKDIPTLIYFAK